MKRDIEEILFDEDTIKGKIKELAAKIQEDYKDKDLLMVGVLNGAVIFYVNLMMEMDIIKEMKDRKTTRRVGENHLSNSIRLFKVCIKECCIFSK